MYILRRYTLHIVRSKNNYWTWAMEVADDPNLGVGLKNSRPGDYSSVLLSNTDPPKGEAYH